MIGVWPTALRLPVTVCVQSSAAAQSQRSGCIISLIGVAQAAS